MKSSPSELRSLLLADTWHFWRVWRFGAKLVDENAPKWHNAASCIWPHTQRDTQVRQLKHLRAHAVCYLPCSSGNSPASSDNLDQSVGSMNPHLPGAQGKISRPCQVVRDWRHEITFDVLNSLLSHKHNAEAGETRTHTHAHKKKKWGSFIRCTLPSHPFAAELRHQLWWWAVLLRAPHQDAKTLAHSQRGVNFIDAHVLAKLSSLSRSEWNQSLQLGSSLLKTS